MTSKNNLNSLSFFQIYSDEELKNFQFEKESLEINSLLNKFDRTKYNEFKDFLMELETKRKGSIGFIENCIYNDSQLSAKCAFNLKNLKSEEYSSYLESVSTYNKMEQFVDNNLPLLEHIKENKSSSKKPLIYGLAGLAVGAGLLLGIAYSNKAIHDEIRNKVNANKSALIEQKLETNRNVNRLDDLDSNDVSLQNQILDLNERVYNSQEQNKIDTEALNFAITRNVGKLTKLEQQLTPKQFEKSDITEFDLSDGKLFYNAATGNVLYTNANPVIMEDYFNTLGRNMPTTNLELLLEKSSDGKSAQVFDFKDGLVYSIEQPLDKNSCSPIVNVQDYLQNSLNAQKNANQLYSPAETVAFTNLIKLADLETKNSQLNTQLNQYLIKSLDSLKSSN